MKSFQVITDLLSSDLRRSTALFRELIGSSVSQLDAVLRHIIDNEGKQIRPVLILLSAKACGGITEVTYRAASMIETLHLATLIHDDVVDEASLRRNRATVNAEWGNKVAVLTGDYLLSKAMNMALDHQHYDLLRLMSKPIAMMSEGEILQLQYSESGKMTEEVYYRIIRSKTAILFAASCACGALSAGASADKIEFFSSLGDDLGMAFQIKDDLLDLMPDRETGKLRGNDLLEKKITLPVLYYLEHSTPEKKAWAEAIIRDLNSDHAQLEILMQDICSSDAIAYAEDKIRYFLSLARQKIALLPPSDAQQIFVDLVDFLS